MRTTNLQVLQGASVPGSYQPDARKGVSVRVLGGDLQRGDGFQAGLDVLLLSAVSDAGVEAFLAISLTGRQLALASDLLTCRLQPVDRALPAAATLALAAFGARRRGGGDIGAGGRRGVQHLEPSDRNDGEQTAGLLLGVKREVAEDVLVMRTGSDRQTGGQAAPLILKRHIGSVSGLNIARSFFPQLHLQSPKIKNCEKCSVSIWSAPTTTTAASACFYFCLQSPGNLQQRNI